MRNSTFKTKAKYFSRKLLSFILVLMMIVSAGQVGLIELAPKAEAVAQSSWDALNAACWSGEVYGTGGAYSVQAWNDRNYTIYDNSGNSTIWNIAIAFQQVYAEVIAENPNNNPVDLVNYIYSNDAFWARYGYVYNLFRWLGMSMDGYGYSNWAGNPKVDTAEVVNTASAVEDNNSCFVQISRDLDCALRDWKYTNVNDLPNDQIQTYFYYAWATGIYDHTEKGKTGGWIKFDKWTRTSYYYINGGLNMWQNPQYTDCSNVPYLKNVINTFYDGNGINTYLDFNTMLTYDQGTLYNMAVAANNGYSPVYWEGRYGANGLDDATVWYWYMLHFAGAGAWIDTWNIPGVSVPFSGVWWRVPGNRLETEGFNNNYNTKVNSIHNYVTNINNAYQAKAYVDYVNYINAVRTNGYDIGNIDQMNEYYNNVTAFFNAINGASDVVKNILTSNLGYDAAATQALINQLRTDIDRFWVRANHDAIEIQMDAYGRTEYSAEQQAGYGTVYNLRHLSDDELNYVIYAIGDVWNTAITNYSNSGYGDYVASIYPNGRMYIYNYVDSARWELNRRGAEVKKNQYYSYFLPRMTGTYVDKSTAEIEAIISEANGVQSGFNADFNSSVATIGQKATNEIYPVAYNAGYANFNIESQAWIDSLYTILNQRLIAEIDPVLDYLTLNENNINLNTFTKFNSLRNLVEDDIYTWLQNSNSSKITPELAEKFSRLANFINNYNYFVNSYDVSNFVKNDLTSQYPTRYGSETDYARKSGDDYAVTEDRLLSTVSKTDDFILSNDFAELLNLADEEKGINNLEEYIDNTLGEKVFNDKMINTIVDLLFPLLSKELEEALIKFVDEANSGNGYEVNTDFDSGDISGHIEGYLKIAIDEIKHNGKPGKNLIDIFESLGLYIYPCSVAKVLQGKYPQIANTLAAAGRSWDNVDIEALSWGIDNNIGTNARYNAFCAVLGDVFNSLLPILQTLLCGKDFTGKVTDAAYAYNNGDIKAKVKYSILSVSPTITALGATADVTLGITGLNLYKDIWVPVMEALGLNTVEHPYAFANLGPDSSAEAMVKGLFEPVLELVNEVCDGPIERIVEMLPNLAFYISFDKLTSLLNGQVLNLSYSIDAEINKDEFAVDNLSGTIEDIFVAVINGLDFTKGMVNDTLSLNVGELIDIADILELTDATDINQLVKYILSLDGLENISLPILNIGELISLANANGNYQTQRRVGTRTYFTADKADVFYRLFNNVFTDIANRPFIENLINEINKTKDEEGNKPISISDDIYGIIDNIAINPSLALCAIVELMNPQEYSFRDITWFKGEEYDAIEGVTPASTVYLNYANNWTKDKAEYIVNNSDEILGAVLGMAGLDIESVNAKLTSGISSLLANKTITSLVKNLVSLGDLLDEKMIKLVEKETGVNLSTWATAFGYLFDEDDSTVRGSGLDRLSFNEDVWSLDGVALEDGNVNAFTDVLCYVLEGLAPIVGCILTGQNISLFEKAITMKGYDSYSNSVAYIFESLGIKAMSHDEYVAKYSNAPVEGLNYLVKNLLGKVKEILENPVNEILALLPNIVYFLESNGLSVALGNLLHPVLVLLDTINPIYSSEDIDLNEIALNFISDLLDEESEIDVHALGLNVKDLSLEKILVISEKIIEDKYGIKFNAIASPALRALCTTTEKNTSSVASGENYVAVCDNADTLTVLVTALIEILQYNDNAKKIDEIAGTNGILEAVVKMFNTTVSDMAEPDWAYAFRESDGTFDYNDLPSSAALSQFHTVNMLSYSNNWTESTAKYVDANLDEIILDIAKSAGSESASISDLIGTLNIYSGETVAKLAGAVKALVEKVDPVILDLFGNVIGIDLSAILDFSENAEDYNVTDSKSFVNAICDLLAPVEPILSYMFFGTSFEYLTSSGIIENTNKGDSVIKLEGAEGYKYGIIPVLEALGINAKSADEYDKAIDCLKDTLSAICSVLDDIGTDPVNKVLAIIPNILYFINANGLTTSVNNALAAFYSLVDTINEVTGDKIEVSEALGFDLSDLSMNAILTLVKDKTGIDLLSTVGDIITTFYVGTIESFESANGRQAFKMRYDETEDRADMITIIVTIAALVIKDNKNAEAVSKLFGEDTYEVIQNVLNSKSFDMDKIIWKFVEDADTGKVYSSMDTSKIFSSGYLALFTKDKAEYIAKHYKQFIDAMISVLGIQIEDHNIEDLDSLINEVIGGSIYTADNANKLLGAIKNAVGKINELKGGKHIKEVIKSSLNIDLDFYSDFTIAEFAEGDRAAFEQAIVDTLAPLAPVLKWLLCDEDISFFVDAEGEDVVTLLGAEGYKYGIIPVLEAIYCDGIVSPDTYIADAKNDNAKMISAITKPLFDKIDVILANPAEEIFNILPNLIYFINSNGLDVCFKNITHSIQGLLNAIKPMTDVDLYEVIGIDLRDATFESLINLIFSDINDKTGLSLEELAVDAVAELTNGTVVSYNSLTGEKAYRMEFVSTSDEADMITTILKLVFRFICVGDNAETIKQMIVESGKVTEDCAKYLSTLIDLIAVYCGTDIGLDTILFTVYYIFYGLNIGFISTDKWMKSFNGRVSTIYKALEASKNPYLAEVAIALDKVFDKYTKDVVDSEGIASSGQISFFTKIINWFKQLIQVIKEFFNK